MAEWTRFHTAGMARMGLPHTSPRHKKEEVENGNAPRVQGALMIQVDDSPATEAERNFAFAVQWRKKAKKSGTYGGKVYICVRHVEKEDA